VKRAIAFAAVVALLLASPGRADERLVAIVNAHNPVRRLSDSDMRNIYLGRTKFWDDRTPIEPFLRPESTSAGRTFFAQLLQMTPSRFRHHWQGLQLSGQGTAPHAIDNPRTALAQIAVSRGGVSFATEAEAHGADARIKVIPIR
jgi:ABC-type phosphate transport system substrate-binding protein